ncbi:MULTISPECIES: HD domain-containing protein [Vagococcus]|uniref:HD domain protein n=1 Tax=Vagococcus fluvialis bH819 TaxID=1255619 RepID=A0A1X6WMV0_9ENTE|nr:MULTISPECIES: HD domain-containing protein [Vagococcus]SLM85597.1 HD domain protein [Vagococcus fluvialis bH819]HCM89566.1 HD domain-containing protein [Vagococcus sp.]
MNQEEFKQLEQIKSYAEKVLLNDKTGHNMDHIYRVVRAAEKIQKVEGGNLFIVLSGAYLHDVMDDKLVSDVPFSRKLLADFLSTIEITEKDSQHIFEVIDHVSFSHQLEHEDDRLSLEAQIVQDADRLDAIGAIGIGRTFYYGGKKGHAMYDSKIPPRKNMTKEDYRINQTVINHFYEKLFLLKDMMHTTTAKKIAEKRQQLMELFVEDFISDWEK